MAKLEVGDILFIDSGTILSHIIKRVTDYPYSHVALVVGDNQLIEITAFTKSKVIRLEDEDIKHAKVKRLRRKLTDVEKIRIAEHANLLVNRSYDYKAVGYLLMNYLLGVNIDPFKNTMDRVYCVEAVDYIYNATGIDLVKGHENNLLTIKDLYDSEHLYTVQTINR